MATRMPTLTRRVLATTVSGLALFGLFQTAGCGDNFDPKSLLNSYRVIGIQADKPALPADGSTQVRVFDFDPASLQGARTTSASVKYAWHLCLYSLGSAGEYKCAAEQLDLLVPGDGPEVTLDLGPNGLDLPGKVPILQALAAQFLGTTTPITRLSAVLELTSGSPEIGEVKTVKNLTIFLPGDPEADKPNHNPTLTNLRVNGNPVCPKAGVTEGCAVAWPAESTTLDLTIELGDNAAEVCTPSDLAARRCDTETGRESLFLTWYTTEGKLKFGNTNQQTLENMVSLPADLLNPDETVHPVRLFVALRDGRGGLDVAEGYFSLTRPLKKASSHRK